LVEEMAEKPEDFNMPSAVVSKLMKDALPEGVIGYYN
jgi:hypothetical protein